MPESVTLLIAVGVVAALFILPLLSVLLVSEQPEISGNVKTRDISSADILKSLRFFIESSNRPWHMMCLNSGIP